MINPNNAIGTNAAYSGRTSVNAFNDDLAAYSRGILSGWNCQVGTGLTVMLGGGHSVRDVAIAEDNAGNKTTINNISLDEVPVTLDTAPGANSRIDLIVAYVDNPPQGSNSTADNPEACGIIPVAGTPAADPQAPDDNAIRTAITADGASGTTAYYVVLATVTVPTGTTDLIPGYIQQGDKSVLNTNQIADGSITSSKIDFTTLSMITLKGSYGDSTASANSKISLDSVYGVVGDKLTKSSDNGVKIGAGVTKVLVSASAFYSSNGSAYGWCRIQKNNSDTNQSAIANLTSSSYGTAAITPFILSVQENDVIKLWNNDAAKVRGTATWMTVIALA